MLLIIIVSDGKKIKNGRIMKICRLGFPRKTTTGLTSNTVAQSIHGRRSLNKARLYNLPRIIIEGNINDYNPAFLQAWQGNTDTQYIGEKSSLLSRYFTKFITKAEKSSAADDFSSFAAN